MRFSILVPVYNVEKYLAQCIESVLSQDYTDYELILVNDGSTDDSPQICLDYASKDNRIRYYSKDNEGLLLTRRFGIRQAEGEYLLFLDSDDYWEPNILSIINSAIKEYDTDMIVYRFNRCKDDGTLLYKDVDIFEDRTVFENENKEAFVKMFVSSSRLNVMWSKCVKKNIVDREYDYSPFNDKKGEDLLQSIALIRNASSILYLNAALYNYRLSPSGRGRNFKIKYIYDYEAVRQHVYNNLLEMNVGKETIEAFFSRYLEGLMDYMGRIVRSSSSYQEFVGYCEKMKRFNLMSLIETADYTFPLCNKQTATTYFLFIKEKYRRLYIEFKIKNAIKGFLQS